MEEFMQKFQILFTFCINIYAGWLDTKLTAL